MKLSEVQKRILKVAAASGGNITPTELANLANCPLKKIYESVQNDEFRGLFFDVLIKSVAAEVPVIVKSFLAQAKGGSYQHGKLLLEVAGFYQEKKEAKIDVTINESDAFKNDEERKAFLRATIKGLVETEE